MQLRKILNALLFALIAMCLVFSLVGCDKNNQPNGGGMMKNFILIQFIFWMHQRLVTGVFGIG